MKPPGKKVTILGLGKSGLESALFLSAAGFWPFVSEFSDTPSARERAEKLLQRGIPYEIGRHTAPSILQADWVLISPGIPPAAPIYQAVRAKKIPIYSEIEVASWFSPTSKIIAVTGTCGKTTVSTLLSRVFQQTKGRAVLCGNVGNPWIGEVSKTTAEDFVVLEVSSFQLVHCETFRPAVGVLLNLSANHQDWHPDMEDYVRAKLRLFQNQGPEDFALVRRADQSRYFPDFPFRARVLYLDENPDANPNEEVLRKISRLFDCDAKRVEDVLRNFEGLEHRLEKVAVAGGVQYINDSKCTTSASLAWALEKFKDAGVILIAGGHPKSNDFAAVKDLVGKKVKTAVLIGEARPLLREAWQNVCPVFEADGFRSAIQKAQQMGSPGDTVLLSPACASFDMFKNYEERGALFKKVVGELTAASTLIDV